MNLKIEVQGMVFIKSDVANIVVTDGMVTIRLKDQEVRIISEEEWYGIECYFSSCLIMRIRQYYKDLHQNRMHILIVVMMKCATTQISVVISLLICAMFILEQIYQKKSVWRIISVRSGILITSRSASTKSI